MAKLVKNLKPCSQVWTGEQLCQLYSKFKTHICVQQMLQLFSPIFLLFFPDFLCWWLKVMDKLRVNCGNTCEIYYCLAQEWVLLCLFTLLELVEWYSHWSQVYSFSLVLDGLRLFCLSPVCVIKCLFSLLFETKALLHWLHLYGFSPVWVLLTWTWRLLTWLLEYGQEGHLLGPSPEWVVLCLFKLLDMVEEYSHWSHSCGFSPEWVLLCLFISLVVIDE